MNALPRHRGTRTQSETFDQLQTRHAFQDEQDGLFIDRLRSDLRVATLARLKVKFEARDLLPEHFVVEGRKPLLDLFHIDERVHPAMVPNGGLELQIVGNS